MFSRFLRFKRGAAIAGVTALTASLGLVAAVPAQATTGFAFTRVAGATRFDTAAALAEQAFPGGAPTALIATGFNFPDALAGNYLAGQDKAPILLVNSSGPLPAGTVSALSTLKTANVIILGLQAAVGNDVQSELAALTSTSSAGGNISVTRIGGALRYDTAQLINQTPGASAVGTFQGKKTAFLARGDDFPDALGAGPVAYAEHFPVILTTPTSLSTQAAQTIANLGIQQLLILGGTNAISSSVEAAADTNGVTTLARFAGSDRSDTSRLVADYAIANFGFQNSKFSVASGDESYGGADALTSGPFSATQGPIPTLVTNTVSDAGQVVTFYREHFATETAGFAIGGTNPLPDSTLAQILAAPPTGAVVLSNNTATPGGAITGTVSNPGSVTSVTVSGCGLTNASVPFSPTTGAFSVTVPTTQTPGTCTLTFTATNANGTTQTTVSSFSISPSAPAGSVTLASATAPAGGTVSGTVTNPSQVSTVTVSGCGLGTPATSTTPAVPAPVTFNATTGAFSLTIPASQAAGGCTLSFTSTLTNGTTQATNVPFTVGATSTGGVALAQTSGAPGSTLTGTVTNPGQVSTLTVSGCGQPTNTPVTFNTTSGAFSFQVPQAQPAGACTMTFTATNLNGTTQVTTVPFTVSTVAGQTVRPQLVSSSILRTTLAGSSTAANPAGTYVQYVFSQPVNNSTLNAAGFHVYDAADTQYTACAGNVGPNAASCVFIDPSNSSAVDALFNSTGAGAGVTSPTTPTGTAAQNLQTTAGAANLTLATVVGPTPYATAASTTPALTNGPNGSNPAGSAPIGTASSSNLPAGVTAAPNLESITATGVGATSATAPLAVDCTALTPCTAVNFTFDKPAFVQTSAGGLGGGFSIVFGPGLTAQAGLALPIAATGNDEEGCYAPANGASTTGTTIPAGNGTTTITVLCPNPSQSVGTALTTSQIARGIVALGAVGTTQPAANGGVACSTNGSTANSCGPLQASDTPHTASASPYLTTVLLNPSANTVLYTFDEPVTLTAAAAAGVGFAAYTSSGATVTPVAVAPAVSGNSVLVTFTAGSLNTAVGANVAAGSVLGTNSLKTNADDELGAGNPNANGVTPGTVNAPQLASVAKSTTTTGFLTPQYGAIYTFTQPVGTAVSIPVAAAGLKLYDTDGTELVCNGTVAGNTLVISGKTVACYSYTVGPILGGVAATATQAQSAVLGTVDYATVLGTAATGTSPNLSNPNPEGAAAAM